MGLELEEEIHSIDDEEDLGLLDGLLLGILEDMSTHNTSAT